MFKSFNLRKTAAVGIGALLLTGLVACGDSKQSDDAAAESNIQVDTELRAMLPQEIQDSGTIKIGTPYGVPPSIFVDENGDPTGIAHDVAEGIGEILDVEIQWQELQFSGVISGLQSGNFDLSMGVIGDTPERQELLDFVDLMANDSVLLTQKGKAAEVPDLESACGHTLGALAGSLQIELINEASDACVANRDGAIKVNEYPSNPEAQAQVQSGRVDGYLAPYILQNYTAQTAGNGETFEIGSGFYPDYPWAIAMQKDRGELSEAIQGALLSLVETGEYQSILEEYDSPDAALTSEQVLINGAGTDAFKR